MDEEWRQGENRFPSLSYDVFVKQICALALLERSKSKFRGDLFQLSSLCPPTAEGIFQVTPS